MTSYAFVDASNLFYGGEKSLGWKIDYEKLLSYLEEKYEVQKTLYFGGIEIHNYPYNYLENETVPLEKVEKHLLKLLDDENLNEAELRLIGRHLDRLRFYKVLENFGYNLLLKPVKTYEQDDGSTKRKANCDVDMAFHMMRLKNEYDRALVLSGDGDFFPLLKHLQNEENKEIIILARGPRTAKELKRLAGGNFRDFEYLRELLKMKEK